MTRGSRGRGAPAVILIGLLAGCYTLPATPPPAGQGKPATAGGAGAPVSSGKPALPPPSSGTPGMARVPAKVDSLPSPDALSVLASIPEPLAPNERVPPAASARPDTTQGEPSAQSLVDSTLTDVPIPTPTLALGQRPAAPDTTPPGSVSSPGPGVAAGGAASLPGTVSQTSTASEPSHGRTPPPAARPTRAALDTCWRVQLAAPPERPRAERLRAAGESLLLVPMTVELEKRRFKVRTRDCMDGSAADLLRQRAVAAGFSGAFRFHETGR